MTVNGFPTNHYYRKRTVMMRVKLQAINIFLELRL